MNSKSYYQKNKERLQRKSRERYYQNRERLGKKVTCECGDVLSFQNMRTHLKTKLHAKRLRLAILKKFCERHIYEVQLMHIPSETSTSSSNTSMVGG